MARSQRRTVSAKLRKALTWLAILLMAVDTVSAGHLLSRIRCGQGPLRRVASQVRCRGGLFGHLKSKISAASCSTASSGSCAVDACSSGSEIVSEGEIVSDGWSGGEVISEGEVIVSDGIVSDGVVISDNVVYGGEVISDGVVVSEGIVSEGIVSDGYVSDGYVSNEVVISEGEVYSGDMSYSSDVVSSGEVILDGGYSNVVSEGTVVEGCADCAQGVSNVSDGIILDGGYTGDSYSNTGIGAPALGANETVIEEVTILEGDSTGQPTPAVSTDTVEDLGGPTSPTTTMDDSDLFSTPESPAPTAPDPIAPAPVDPVPVQPMTPEPIQPLTPDPVEPAGDEGLFGPADEGTDPAPAEGGDEDLNDLFSSASEAPEFVNDEAKPPIELNPISRVTLRTWTDNSGLYSVDARLKNITADSVVLEKENGKTCTVSFERLSVTDLEYVQRLASHFGVAPLNLVAAK